MSSDSQNEAKKPAILFIGAPGSGKGTQGKALGMLPRFFHCACGDVFRSLDTRTPLGQEFVKYSRRGELVPDQFTIDLWLAQIENWIGAYLYKPDVDILVLDGIPRNVPQAEILREHLEVHQVYHLSCPERGELARRMRKRALKDNRIDDANESVIQHRIDTYEQETKPILDFYAGNGVTNIDANQSPAEVFHAILGHIIALPAYKEILKVKV